MRIEITRGLAPGAYREGLDAARVRRMLLAGLAIGVAAFVQAATARPSGGATVLFYVLLALWAAVTAIRHRLLPPWPGAAWTALFVGGAVIAGLSASGASGPTFLAGAGLFLLTSAIEVGIAWIAWTIVAATAGCGLAHALSGQGVDTITSVLVSTVIGGGFGVLARLSGLDRRTQRGAAERRAEKAVLEERARIARDIHDVLAHSLGGLVIQLDALEAVSTARGADEDVLARVRGARGMAADGLVAAKRAVDALRRLPAGIDAALAEIAGGVRALGMTVAVDVRGDPARVPAPVAEVLASVTVETLTNARKHAPHAPVTVVLDVGRDAALLHVTNPVPAVAGVPPVPSGGHGVTGMRERAELVGGTLDARESDGVWSVECRVPYE
ncbi:sensor histidine kinase [Streptomyces sp. NBC_01497]|uniref:sensor histidine kinase n=1 Tax=Streptomyces sp. NBC_01497 TaxID=2903885 RepID=UPI002E36210F|nr:histidine kinase [Streptomyces sp. NBC_01497]